jgi:hypothetical protein
MCFLKSQFDQNLIIVNHNSNVNFKCSVCFDVKCFRRKIFSTKSFFRKNDFPENIFWCLARTKKYQRHKTKSGNRRKNLVSSSHLCQNLASTAKFQFVSPESGLIWLKFGRNFWILAGRHRNPASATWFRQSDVKIRRSPAVESNFNARQ